MVGRVTSPGAGPPGFVSQLCGRAALRLSLPACAVRSSVLLPAGLRRSQATREAPAVSLHVHRCLGKSGLVLCVLISSFR